ncbi:MAG: hypothetical protein IJ773_13850 [Lachnospiraceae bacterium]|nr:hypothetical protein [Lachnospiraceae bacterium]
MKNLLSKRGPGGVLVLLAAVLTVIAIIAYTVNGNAIRNVNTIVVILLGVALAGELVTLFAPLGGLPILISAVASGAAVGYYLSFSADYLGYLFTGVLGYAGTMASFILFAAAAVISILLLIAANFCRLEK